MTTVILRIFYITPDADGAKTLRQGEFPLKGKKPEEVAYQWWKDIKREYFLELHLYKVMCEDKDITDLVKALEAHS